MLTSESEWDSAEGWISTRQLYIGLAILVVCAAIFTGFLMGAAHLARACGL